MERESSVPPRRRRDGGGTADDLGHDDEEFASVEDTGPEPTENPQVDDV